MFADGLTKVGPQQMLRSFFHCKPFSIAAVPKKGPNQRTTPAKLLAGMTLLAQTAGAASSTVLTTTSSTLSATSRSDSPTPTYSMLWLVWNALATVVVIHYVSHCLTKLYLCCQRFASGARAFHIPPTPRGDIYVRDVAVQGPVSYSDQTNPRYRWSPSHGTVEPETIYLKSSGPSDGPEHGSAADGA